MSELKALHEQAVAIGAADGIVAGEARFFTTDTGAHSIQTRGPASTGIWVDWGDGESEWIEHTGTGNTITTSHTYSGSGVKHIVFTGELTAVTSFLDQDTTFAGNISEFANFEGLSYRLYINGTNIIGDISTIAGLTSLQYLYIYTTAIEGNISALSGMTGLIYFNANASSVSGDISALAALTSLQNLQIETTSVSGDIVNLAALTSVTNLRMSGTSVSGDIGDLAPLTGLTHLRFSNTSVSYTTTTLPAWNNCGIQLQDNAWTQDQVDSFLIDLAAAGGSNGTLNVAGTNAARSAASDAAKATLLGNGWAVTVNE